MIRGSKDAALALAVRTFLNARLGTIGEFSALTLDTADRRALVRVALRGEPDPIDIEIREYALDATADGDWLTLVDVAASREWLNALLRQFAVGRPFRIPTHAARALSLLT